MAWSRLFRAARVAASVAAISSRRLSSSAPPLPQRKPTSLLLPGAWVDPPTGEVVEVPLAQTGEGIARVRAAQMVCPRGSHNIGVSMATSYGLVVPNIKKAQSLSILEITKELSRLHKLASNNKLSTEDINGGTITLSNIGAIGGKFGSPLLNLPEVAIIAIGKMQELPRFADDGTMYPASITNVTIGADHRIVDGATVARFCNEWEASGRKA